MADPASSAPQIEQWCEHQYPSYVSIGGSVGKVETKIDQGGGDARVRHYMKVAEAQRQKASLARTEAALARLRERGMLKPGPDGTYPTAKAAEPDSDTLPWKLIVATVVGMLVLFGALASLTIWVIMYYFD